MAARQSQGGIFQTSANPGPGQYSQANIRAIKGPVSFGKDPKMKRGDRNSHSIQMIPGPGQYNPKDDSMFKTVPKSIFGTANRTQNSFYDSKAAKGPGPG